jgi:hypothetical protein
MTSLQKVLCAIGYMMAVPLFLYAWLCLGLSLISQCQRRWGRYGICRKCGCTDDNCSGCVLATGEPCTWVNSSHTLCTRCVDELAPADVDDVFAGCSPLNAKRHGPDRTQGTNRRVRP